MTSEMNREPIEGTLKTVIEKAVRESMAQFGVSSVEIYAGEDHDGDAVLFVEISHDFNRIPIDPSKLSLLITRLRNDLSRSGEKRFPIVRHHFSDLQQVVGYT
jgi:hypothetical protein